MAHSRTIFGNQGEQLVAQHLISQGFTILTQNYSRSYGEIDIIARNNDTVAFVEVKTRHRTSVDMTELITRSKRRKIITVAKEFLAHHTNIVDVSCQFDVALVTFTEAGIDLCYIPNAFVEGE